MFKEIAVSTLVLTGLFVSSAALAKGSVEITNCGTEDVWIGAYDWDDVALEIAYSDDTFDDGDTHTLKCVKSFFDSSSPGCQLVVKAGTSAGMDIASWKVDNGTYTLGSTSTESSDECTLTVSICLKEQSSCSSDDSDNTSNCDKTGTLSYTSTACEDEKLLD